VSDDDQKIINETVKLMAQFEASRDLIEVGAYQSGTNSVVDRAIKLVPELEKFLAQRPAETESRAAAMTRLRTILSGLGAGS